MGSLVGWDIGRISFGLFKPGDAFSAHGHRPRTNHQRHNRIPNAFANQHPNAAAAADGNTRSADWVGRGALQGFF